MRLGGDEFVILLPHVLTARDAAQVAIKTLHAMSEPFTVLGQSCTRPQASGWRDRR
ncbi:MAG: diguanylate cyclase domain-containing protein [Gammaproteobacteria bacterium]